ncbi:MAG: hypothetical protein GW903_03030 [Alphaproteobacteria bacterium]|nr:hypothetical protein [Alphaproteobacteria bacterium]NCQ87945.1 hypothetical protein [Alphaproteobacteria bacterium]NCT05548.1 hypothetical protein [Alphaproteobacteria bacterium]
MPFETVVLKTVEYLTVPAVVGHEAPFIDHLVKDFRGLGMKVERIKGGLAVYGDNPQSNIITAHIDRHGLISLGNGEYAYAAQRVKSEKYREKSKATEKMLHAISERFDNEFVFAYNSETGEKLGGGVIIDCEGAFNSGEEAIFHIRGMKDMDKDIPIAYARGSISNSMEVKGQIDNVISLGVIYTLFQNGFQGTALLCTEEEIGKSWLHIADYLDERKPNEQNLLVIDTSPYRETNPISNGWVTLRNRDKTAVFNLNLVNEIKLRCEQLGIPFQVKDEYLMSLGLEIEDLGSTELGRLVQGTEGRLSGATIQIPTVEYHTSFETTSRICIESYYALLHNLLIKNPIERNIV